MMVTTYVHILNEIHTNNKNMVIEQLKLYLKSSTQ